MYKLRNALKRYNLEEGKDENYIAEIPKGGYTLRIKDKDENCSQKKRNKLLWFAIVLIAVLLGSNGLLIVKNYQQESGINKVWQNYIEMDKPLYITLADPFFFRARNDSTGENYIVRDIYVNTPSEFDTTPNKWINSQHFKISPLEYPYFSQNNLWPLLNIITVFVKKNKDVRIMPLSTLSAEEIKRNNHIVIGNINSFGIFNNYLDKSSIRVKTNPRRILICQEYKDSLAFNIEEQPNGYYLDHAFLVKVPGPDGNIISLLGDFHASGNKGLSHLISDENLLDNLQNKFKKEYGEFPEFFEMVVEVTSYNYEDFETKVVFFKKLEKE